MLNGRHSSRLRGRGLNFEEMRNYLPGDDVRSIDWKATARTGAPHVRVFTEERDRPALIVVDQRMSMFYGSQLNMKSVTAAETAALAAFMVLEAGDRVGGIVFSDDERVEFVPKRSRRTAFAMLERLAEFNSSLSADGPASIKHGGLNDVLRSVARIAHHDHLVIILSDFDGIDETTHRHLTGIARHNDLVLGLVHDPSARNLVRERMVIGDGVMQAEVNFGDQGIRASIAEFSSGRLAEIERWQTEINLSVLPFSAGEETLPQLRRLMGSIDPVRRIR